MVDEQEDRKRINVPQIVHLKWDEMIAPYNSIATKLNQYPQYPYTPSFKTGPGIVVDVSDLRSRIQAVLFKLSWAAKSLEYMIEFYGKFTRSFEDSMRVFTEPIPDTFIFNADAFFCFGYSALDIVGGIIDILVKTGIEKRRVYFTNVLNYLAEHTPFAGTVFSQLKAESDKGWISEFRQYRVFATHHAITRTRSHFRYTASDQETEINPFVLPDDPREIPPTYEKKRELVPYCQDVLVKELGVMKVLFEFIDTLF